MAIGATPEQVMPALANDPAYVAAFGENTVIFSEGAVLDTMTRAIEVSTVVPADIVGFFVFDDDVLASVYCRGGEAIAEVTVPAMADYIGIDKDEMALMAEMMGEEEPGSGNSDDPVAFVTGLGRGDSSRALAILADTYGQGGRVWATQRHRELLTALDLPPAIAGWDYYALEADPEGFEGEAVLVSPSA